MKQRRLLIIIAALFLSGCAVASQQGNTQQSETEKVEAAEEATELTEITPEVSTMWDPENYASLADIIRITRVENGKNAAVATYQLLYQSDDCQVAAILSVPIACMEQKEAYPCVIFNRGGTGENGANTVETMATIAGTLKMVVFASQYRGNSGGTGKDEYGGADVEDVRKLVDLCEDLPIVDMEQLYMVGVSRGGMMTYMVCRDDDRIKKAVVISGVADAYITYETTTDMRELFDELLSGTPEEKEQSLEQRSATYWADELTCPFLIIHSKGDKIVSFEEAEKLAQELNAADKEYKFIVYDDDVHGLHVEDIPIIINWLRE